MKKLLIASLFLFSTDSFAQNPLPYLESNLRLTCTKTDAVFSVLKNEYKETPVGVGKLDRFVVIIWKGLTNDNFTVTISSEQTDLTCSVIEGTELKLLIDKPT